MPRTRWQIGIVDDLVLERDHDEAFPRIKEQEESDERDGWQEKGWYGDLPQMRDGLPSAQSIAGSVSERACWQN